MQQLTQATGFACPQCSNRIIVNYYEMLNCGQVQCHSCGLQLQLNREKSDKALQAANLALNNVEQAKTHAEQQNYQQQTPSRAARGRGRPRQQRLSRSSRR